MAAATVVVIDMAAETDMVEAIVTAAETATEAEGMAARGAMAAAAVTGADRLVRTTGVAAEVATGGRAPGPTPHVSQPTGINFTLKCCIICLLIRAMSTATNEALIPKFDVFTIRLEFSESCEASW